MALKKQIELENGIILNYHRIVSISKITNNMTTVEVASYISETQRQKEQEALIQSQEIGEAIPISVFINTVYVNKEYVEDETIKDLYEFLKTTKMFKDAENA